METTKGRGGVEARARRRGAWAAVVGVLAIGAGCAGPGESIAEVEVRFHDLGPEARRETGPLFWLHGDESPELLRATLGKVAEGGNGCFTAESRPHADWLGPGWYRDLGICLEEAKRLDLEMWIFDERWWPSGEVAGRVPAEYGSKNLEAASEETTGPTTLTREVDASHLVAVLAGRGTDDGIDGDSLVDLTDRVRGGTLTWHVPAGSWQVIVFTWSLDDQRGDHPLVDGASRDAVDWYLDTVYQPHYDHFAADFGGAIKGFFYDEPETYGDWGTEVIPMLVERGVDWRKALVAWKIGLAGEEGIAARYQYRDALAEAWGRTLYGGITRWCEERGVESIGHFLEHSREYLSPRQCAGNMFQLQKYSSMGGIDAVFAQFVMGKRAANNAPTWQTPKLGSSITHAYGKRDDLAMVEIFGARGQDLSYREMKWWTDHMQVSGINFHIPHSFNPRAPRDGDCPPYFYNGGCEPRWPLYRVYADYTSRLSLLLSGGKHVCPVAFLYLGQSHHEGESLTPEDLTSALQDALYDCDWLPYDVFLDDVRLAGEELLLREERYRVLVVPAAEVVPFEVLEKAQAFFAAGGTVVGYGILPTASATLGHTAAEIATRRTAIWGEAPQPGLEVCRTNAAGGRSYFLPAAPRAEDVRRVLRDDAHCPPTLDVVEGDTRGWLHVLHRVKAERDVFFVTNQVHEGSAQRFTLRARASGVPERWDPMRDEITALPHRRRDDGTVDFTLELAPLESALVVFQAQDGGRPALVTDTVAPLFPAVVVHRLANPLPPPAPERRPSALEGCTWIRAAGDDDSVPAGTWTFRGRVSVDEGRPVASAHYALTADNDFVLTVNGREVARGPGGYEDWRTVQTIDVTALLRAGDNEILIQVTNFDDQPNPFGLIGCGTITYDDGGVTTAQIDGTWQVREGPLARAAADEVDVAWDPVHTVAPYGAGPWGRFAEAGARLTLSPIVADPFRGRFTVPTEWCTEGHRIYLEMDGLELGAAAVTIDGAYAGGVIGAPFRIDVTRQVGPGDHELLIEPRAPSAVRIVAHPGRERVPSGSPTQGP